MTASLPLGTEGRTGTSGSEAGGSMYWGGGADIILYIGYLGYVADNNYSLASSVMVPCGAWGVLSALHCTMVRNN